MVVNTSVRLYIMKSCGVLERLDLISFRSVNEDRPPTSAAQMSNIHRVSLQDCDSVTILSHIATPMTAFINVVMNHRRRRAR